MLRRMGGGRAWRRFAALIWAGAGLWVLSACVMTPAGVAVNPVTSTTPRVRVVAGSVGLYAEADPRAARKGALVRDEEAAALGRARACQWLYVRTEDGRSGWIPANPLFVTLDSPCEEVAKGIVAPSAPLAQDAEAMTVRGRLAYLAQNHAQAVDEYTQALAADASYSLAYHGRGAAQAALGDYEAALADYDAALNLVPDLLPALRDRRRGLCGAGPL